MADFTTINQEIDNNIKQNGVNAITGQKLNTVLKDMMSAVNTEKQDTIDDLAEIRTGAEAGAAAYQMPEEGIPSRDLSEGVQKSLENADNAVLYEEQSTKTDQQRNTALANVSNQTANSTTGKMGYKVLDPTKTFASQVTAENTIYEIRDVFDLGGTQETPVSVTLPANSTLKFNGGIIKNCTLNGNNTSIDAPITKIFDTSVVINGTWRVKESYPEWFGAVGQNGIDDVIPLTKAMVFKNVFLSRIYYISTPLQLSSSIISGKDVRYFNFSGIKANDDFESITITDPRTENEYVVKGLTWHFNDSMIIFNNVYLDANFKASYCIQHVTGASHFNCNNLVLINAKIAGVLQYGCEQPIWNNLIILRCNVGVFCSNYEIDENNPGNFTNIYRGSSNELCLNNCRVESCNYGIIKYGGSPFNLHDLVIAYNNRVGLYVKESSVTIDSIYSECDGMCMEWLNDDGTMSYAEGETNRVFGKSSKYMVDNDLDGFVYNGVYYRSPIVIDNSSLDADRLYISYEIRSSVYNPQSGDEADFTIETQVESTH